MPTFILFKHLYGNIFEYFLDATLEFRMVGWRGGGATGVQPRCAAFDYIICLHLYYANIYTGTSLIALAPMKKNINFFRKSLARLPSAPKEGKRYSKKAKDIQGRQKILKEGKIYSRKAKDIRGRQKIQTLKEH